MSSLNVVIFFLFCHSKPFHRKNILRDLEVLPVCYMASCRCTRDNIAADDSHTDLDLYLSRCYHTFVCMHIIYSTFLCLFRMSCVLEKPHAFRIPSYIGKVRIDDRFRYLVTEVRCLYIRVMVETTWLVADNIICAESTE